MTSTKETPLQRLERLRAQKAERERAAREALPVRPGDQFHVLKTGIGIHTGGGLMSSSHISTAGETITVTDAMIAASYAASGWSWMTIIGDDEAQRQKWGEIRFGIGPAPDDVGVHREHGTAEWRMAREQARQDAWREPDAERRAAALAAVNAKYGSAPVTSTIIGTAPDPSIRLAAEQQKALNEGGVRHVSHYVAQEPGVRR